TGHSSLLLQRFGFSSQPLSDAAMQQSTSREHYPRTSGSVTLNNSTLLSVAQLYAVARHVLRGYAPKAPIILRRQRNAAPNSRLRAPRFIECKMLRCDSVLFSKISAITLRTR